MPTIPDMSHQRDPVEIWKLAWDETNQVLKTSATLSLVGGIEVIIDHLTDSIAIGDGEGSLRKAGVNTDFELLVNDPKVKTAVDTVNSSVGALSTKIPYKLGIDYNESIMTLSAGDTVETWNFYLSATFVFKVILTYTDNTRQTLTQVVHSTSP